MPSRLSFLVLSLFCLQALADDPKCPSNVINDYNKICDGTKPFAYVSGGLRSSASILISAFAVYAACSWSILRFNVPDPTKSFWKRGWPIYLLVALALFTPEIMAMLSLIEYMNAYQHHRQMRALGAGHWSMMHAFMANMGGLALHAGDSAPFLVTGPMLEVLVKEGVIDIPDIEKEEIEDKSKTDLVGKIFTMVQAAWLIVTTIARKVDGLAIAPIEITACLHVLVSIMTYFLQWHKPQGVKVSITI
ncbi:hypothetical protein K458DRAFT_365181, partial [Lentithecium fluviatile CBS 122367]